MKKTIEVVIGGQIYRLTADEADREYTERIASYVNAKFREYSPNGELAFADGLLLAAVNIADDYFKATEQLTALRTQLQSCIEQAARTKGELADARRELSRVKNKSRAAKPEQTEPVKDEKTAPVKDEKTAPSKDEKTAPDKTPTVSAADAKDSGRQK